MGVMRVVWSKVCHGVLEGKNGVEEESRGEGTKRRMYFHGTRMLGIS
jgi:predicted RNA-binding protein Jag